MFFKNRVRVKSGSESNEGTTDSTGSSHIRNKWLGLSLGEEKKMRKQKAKATFIRAVRWYCLRPEYSYPVCGIVCTYRTYVWCGAKTRNGRDGNSFTGTYSDQSPTHELQTVESGVRTVYGTVLVPTFTYSVFMYSYVLTLQYKYEYLHTSQAGYV